MPSRDTAKPKKLPTGKYEIRWVDINGDRKKLRFDSKEDANRELKRIRIEIEDIRAGLKDRPPPDKTFNELCDYWLAQVAPLKRSGKHDVSIIRAHLRPFFGPMLLRTIGQEAARRFHKSRQHLNIKTVHNQLTLLISMLRVAGPDELKWIDRVPRIKKPKVRLFNRDYKYLRTPDEVRRLLFAAREEGEVIFALYATAVYTGMRAGELAGLR